MIYLKKMNIVTPLAIFLGAVLVFFLQPMVGRTLLPVFGGSAAVWSVCLATFQMLLVGGYFYAHILGGIDNRKKRRLHIAMIALAVVWAFTITLAGLQWMRAGVCAGKYPALEVLLLVLLGVGVPYMVISAGSSLLQSWAAARMGQKSMSIYRLYAVSNLGSFIGLFAYPFLMEPFVPLHLQWGGWSAVLAIYLILVTSIALQKKPAVKTDLSDQAAPSNANSEKEAGAAARLPRVLAKSAWWYILPGISTFILNSTTNYLSMDIAPVPLLWAILLGAFLLSYVTGFSRAGEKLLPLWRTLMLCALTGNVLSSYNTSDYSFLFSVGAGILFVFLGGTFLHSWLYSARPEGARLTRFYLGIAVGGAVGGLFVSFGAPLVFSNIWEYPAAIFACALAGLFYTLCLWKDGVIPCIFNGLIITICVSACILLGKAFIDQGQNDVFHARNFYGIIRVVQRTDELAGGNARIFSLINGGTVHGLQVRYEDGVEGRFADAPTTYFGPHGGGLAFSFSPKWRGVMPEKLALSELSAFELPHGYPMRAAIIGLGMGSMAVWGREGDDWNYYEINPLVGKVARDNRYFSSLKDSRANINIIPGDARLLLEQERAEGAPLYDILIADAYTGDHVPMQLATEEAFRLYADRLSADGVLAIHISNWHLDLLPLCKAVAAALEMNAVGVLSPGNEDELTKDSLWVFLTRNQVNVDAAGTDVELADFSQVRDIRLPTDDWGGLQSLIRFNVMIPVLGKDIIADGSINTGGGGSDD